MLFSYVSPAAAAAQVACDNPDCPIEWFHFECVGLTEQPRGKWYCRDCEAQRAAGDVKPAE